MISSKQIDFTNRGVATLDSVGGQNLNVVSPVALNFDSIEDINNDYITKLSDSAYRIDRSNLYQLSLKVYAQRISGGEKNVIVAFYIDGNIEPKTITTHAARANNGSQEAIFTLPPTLVNIPALSIITVQAFRAGGGGRLTTVPDASWFRIEKL